MAAIVSAGGLGRFGLGRAAAASPERVLARRGPWQAPWFDAARPQLSNGGTKSLRPVPARRHAATVTTAPSAFGLPLETLETVALSADVDRAADPAAGPGKAPGTAPGTAEPAPLVILHGLFGSKQNWRSLQRAFTTKLPPGTPVVALDLRNHGASPHTAAFTYELMAADVLRHVREHLGGARFHVLGHSMGGKVAMTLALHQPQSVASLVVVDIAPVAAHSDLKAFRGYMDDMRRILARRIQSRKEADAVLAETVDDPMVRAFLLTNLVHGPGGWRFRINLDGLEAALDNVKAFDAGEAVVHAGVPSPAARVPTLFVGGSKGHYITSAHHPRIRQLFPTAEITMLPTGHWVHAEAPHAFLATVAAFLARVTASAQRDVPGTP